MNPVEKKIKETAVMLNGTLNCNESFFVYLKDVEENAFLMAERMWKLKKITNIFVCFAVAIGVGESYRTVGTFDIPTILSNMPVHATVYFMVAVALIIFNKMIVLKSFKEAHHDINMATSIRIEANLVDDEVRQRITAYLKKVGRFSDEIEGVLAKAQYIEPVILKQPVEQIIEHSDDQKLKSDFMDAQVELHKNLNKRLAANPQFSESVVFSSTVALVGISILSSSGLSTWGYVLGVATFPIALGYFALNLQWLRKIKELIDTVLDDDITPEHIRGVKDMVYTDKPYTFSNVGLHLAFGFVIAACVVGSTSGSSSLDVVDIIVFVLALIGGISLIKAMHLSARRADAYKRSNGNKKK